MMADQRLVKILLQCIRVLIFFFFIVNVALNLIKDRGFLFPQFNAYHSYTYLPGKDYLALKPYLDHVLYAGFWTDSIAVRPEVHEDIIQGFYKAQYALVPTLLDIDQPLAHEYVVVHFKDRDHFLSLIRAQRARIIVQLKTNIALIRRPI